MSDPLVLYSTNTRLAYIINERFYGQTHYVWCNCYFSSEAAPRLEVDMPPSSTPLDIYRGYQHDLERKDRHSDNFRRNVSGVLRGMAAKRQAGVIGEEQCLELEAMVAQAHPEDFQPLLYVIPFQHVRELASPVAPSQRAALFAREFLIERLPRSLFDVLWW